MKKQVLSLVFALVVSAPAFASSRSVAVSSAARNFRVEDIRIAHLKASKASTVCNYEEQLLEHCVTFGGSSEAGKYVIVTLGFDGVDADQSNTGSLIPEVSTRAYANQEILKFPAKAFSAQALEKLSAASVSISVKKGPAERVVDEARSSGGCGYDVSKDGNTSANDCTPERTVYKNAGTNLQIVTVTTR